ncbi:MAG: hypothetical protein WA705_07715 [Candidatus Ozemobacteraceae bacterium]
MTFPGFQRRGFVLILVLAVAVVLLLLGVTLHSFVAQQNTNLHLMANAEVAHFLAEAGISSSLRTVREALAQAGISGAAPSPVTTLLQKPQPLPDTSLMPFLKDTWNEDLKAFSTEVDPTASIRVEVWLRGFKQTETDPAAWVDPGAKIGFLAVEATGEYRGMRRTLSVRRPVRVGSSLPPVVSKFTLHVRDASRGSENRFNLMVNDYDGINGDPKPLVVLNHATPESPLEPKALAIILSEEKEEQIFEKRGWIWLGGGKTRLHLTSGPGGLGEIFHFYEVSNPSTFQAVRFKKAVENLPPAFSSPVPLPWDFLNPARTVNYAFGYSYILAGFHDKSGSMDHDAMYLGDVLSPQEKSGFGARSSILHLYGDSRKGFQSRTRVFGRVTAAFPRYASLDVTPQEQDVKDVMAGFRSPPPTYLLPSVTSTAFDQARQIKDIQGRRTGGPILPLGILFQTFDQYRSCMSAVLELPYATSYNSLQELLNPHGIRRFPPTTEILKEDLGQPIEIKRGSETLYKGIIDAPRIVNVAESRVMKEFSDPAEFWKNCIDPETKMLRLNQIVRIVNADKRDLIFPPLDVQPPLKVSGGGMIILEEGNLVLRGIEIQNPTEALSVIAPRATSVRVDTPNPNHLNIYAPQAEFSAGARVDLLGTLAVGGLEANPRSQGGVLRYREAQDPTRQGYFSFYKSCIDDRDTVWHE